MADEQTSTRRLGIVLGGGGVRGLAHAGVLGALERAGIEPSVVVGVSMGAVVGATYCARTDWAKALESVDRTHLPAFSNPRENEGLELLRAALRNARRLAPSFWTWGRQGYEEYGRTTMAQLVGRATTFDQTRVQLGVVATDLQAGERVVMTEGELVPAVLASAAVPGLAKPVEHGGKVLIDGGFADPAPIDVARSLGAEVVLAVYTGQHLGPSETDSWLLTLLRGMEIGQRAFAEERLTRADLVLRPDFVKRVNALNFSEIDDVVSRGVACGRANVDAVRALMAG